MAVMIPSSGPREHDPRSKEQNIYWALSLLPDDYVVVHSLALMTLDEGGLGEAEADFVVFNRSLGLICIEAKAGQVSYSDGEWRYSDGRAMRHGGPFRQADSAKWRLYDCFERCGLAKLRKRCKFLHAVWFPSISRADIPTKLIPPEGLKSFILCLEDLQGPEARIREIFETSIGDRVTDLTEAEGDEVIRRVLAPEFGIVPTARLKYDIADMAFARLLDSQKRVLDFLVDQKSAVISGSAGTGKTLIAIERARRLSDAGSKVLFLCYNRLLMLDIRNRLEGDDGIDVYTIDGFAKKLTGAYPPDYAEVEQHILDDGASGRFPYTDVIVDEGQDFGVEEHGQAGVLEALYMLVTEEEKGSFYLFYDKNQLVQGSGVPDLVSEAECKLTLHINCRNTFNIAKCSTSAIPGGVKARVLESAVDGAVPIAIVSEDIEELERFIDQEIANLQMKGIDDIVVLTCRSLESSVFSGAIGGGASDTWKSTDVPFSTCRRFKGLEADAVILVDVDEDAWIHEPENPHAAGPGMLFYVGASRARHELRIVCNMGDDQCAAVLEALGNNAKRRPRRKLATTLNALPVGSLQG